ncbi:MAG: hypothetical protein KHX25_07580, partial [Firmicutes bacterium]|nr:hypothetical protein [Bacillota bacterium]
MEQWDAGDGIMLYVTTLDRTVTYTAQATLERATGPDGGLFVPMTLPQYDRKGLAALVALPFWECVAEILNQFFPLRLRGCDLQEPEGVCPEPVYIRYKIAVAELWDRKTGSFQGLRCGLCDRLGSKLRSRGNWPFVAVDIALLFGLYGALCRSGWLRLGETVQLAAASGEFTMAVAAWYARRMGLPLGDVICVCNDNGAFIPTVKGSVPSEANQGLVALLEGDSHVVDDGMVCLNGTAFADLYYRTFQQFLRG